MLPALVVLALVAVALAVVAVAARRALAADRAELSALRTTSEEAEAARDQALSERDAARTEAADALRAHEEAAAAAAEAVARADEARQVAEQGRTAAEASVSEAATLAARLIDDGAADPAALWALERARSERTWRHSVAAVAGDPSPLVGARHPLWTALEIEVAAVREEVGAVVDLDVDLPDVVTPGASLAALRVAQELLATAARKGEVTTLRITVEGTDLVIETESVEADGSPVALAPLPIPPSRLEAEPGIVRLHGVLATPVDQPA